MAQFLHSVISYTIRKSHVYLLALFWVLGLFVGDYLFTFAGSNLVSQMPLAAMCQPSIFGLLISFSFPFLFSVFAVYISVPKLLLLIAFAKAVVSGFFFAAVFAAFGDSGWLVRLLLLFTDVCGTVLLYHYWLRHISGVREFSAGALVGYLIPGICIVLADYSYISPLLQRCLL